MKFVMLTEEEFEKASLVLPCSNFEQSVKWGELEEKNGFISHLLGVKEKNKVVAACLLLEKKELKKWSVFYSPNGYLIDYYDEKLLSFFTEEIKNFAKERKGIFVRIEPYCSENNSILESLKSLGYANLNQKHIAFTLDLDGKDENELLDTIDVKAKDIIKNNEKYNIEIREINEEELPMFKNIINSAFLERKIAKSFEDYKSIVEKLKDNSKIYIAELNIDGLIQKLKEKIAESNDEDKELKKELEERIIHYKKIADSDGRRIVLGGIIFVVYNKDITVLFSGSYDKYEEFSPLYTLYWELIKYALNNGYTKCSFRDISEELKKGFKVNATEYAGKFDLVINKTMYLLSKGFKICKK